MSCTFTYKQFSEMDCGRNKQKQRKIASISEHYGDEDLELSDSDEDVDEIHLTGESKRDVSYISKSDSGQQSLTGWLFMFFRSVFDCPVIQYIAELSSWQNSNA